MSNLKEKKKPDQKQKSLWDTSVNCTNLAPVDNCLNYLTNRIYLATLILQDGELL